MSTRTVERVDGWESVPFEGGFAGLRKLAGQEFSGAVIAGPTRLFMLNGTVVGILDGSIEDFESASGTAKQSPHEALPLLAVMQERADEVKAQYYTEDTELAEVDRTLSSGNFTGFIELSENVLSGDYYTVYHQGRSMSVAWVGNSEKLLTDDEAFDTANDEVGIYEVMPVDIEPIEIPEPEGDTAGADPAPEALDEPEESDESPAAPSGDVADSDADTSAAPEATDATAATADPDDAGESDPAPESTPERRPTGGPPGSKAAGANPGGSQRGREADDHPAAGVADREQTAADAEPAADPAAADPDRRRSDQQATEQDDPARGDATAQADTETQNAASPRPDATARTESADTATQPSQSAEPQQSGGRSASAERSPQPPEEPERAEAGPSEPAATSAEPAGGSGGASADLETRSIPSLDPTKSGGETADSTSAATAQPPPGGSKQASTPRRDQPAADPTTAEPEATEPTSTNGSTEPDGTAERAADRTPTQQSPSEQTPADTGPSPQRGDRVAELESELEAKTATVSELESELTDLEATNQELRAEVDRLETDLADARAEIERLEEQLDAQDDTVAGGKRLSVSEAINGTNLFVRYNSKGKATLEEAKNGDASRDEVEENLRLEYHTQFEAEDATVNGTPFQEFLEDSIQYRFVNWLIRNLLYEIRDTGHAGAMKDLYEGLPAIDRAELNGNVTVTYTEDGQENRSQERFDVVVRDRMGNPLVVANINDSREPATEGQMTDLVRNAERVGNASDSFASAFLVTSSFFEPGALETAKEATSSGLFNRDKRKSFVNLSRKEGFHLCLLEARNQEFHLAVPEL